MTDTQKLVCEILEQKPIARTDDFILYGFVLKRYGVSLDMPLKEFFANHKKMQVPNFKTIERARRIVQSVRLGLVDCETAEAREELEEKYHESRGNV